MKLVTWRFGWKKKPEPRPTKRRLQKEWSRLTREIEDARDRMSILTIERDAIAKQIDGMRK